MLHAEGGDYREASACHVRDGEVEFVEPRRSLETVKQILADTREEFAQELAGARYAERDHGSGGTIMPFPKLTAMLRKRRANS